MKTALEIARQCGFFPKLIFNAEKRFELFRKTVETDISKHFIGLIEYYTDQISHLRQIKYKRFHDDECWIYQGDSQDCLESLTCPVVIDAKVLSELLIDAKCFQFWVSEAANAPSSMAILIANCTTEQQYRDAIMPIVTGSREFIKGFSHDNRT